MIELEVFGYGDVISGVHIRNAPSEGITIGSAVVPSGGITVTDSVVEESGGNGIHLSGVDHPVVDGNRVIDSNLTPGTGHEDGAIIWSDRIWHATISNNYIDNA